MVAAIGDTGSMGTDSGGRSLLLLAVLLAVGFFFAGPLRRWFTHGQAPAGQAGPRPSAPRLQSPARGPLAIPIEPRRGQTAGWLSPPWSTAAPSDDPYERVR